MAHFLQGLIFSLLLVVAAAAQQQPFSHRVHLKLQSDCLACHAQAAKSATPADNNLPLASACRPCHETVAIPRPAPTLVRKFSHAQHLKLDNVAPVLAAAIDQKNYLSNPGDLRRHLNTTNACTACHRGLAESDQVTPAQLPRMADCLVCHNRIDPPFSCEMCHDPGPHLRPDSHSTGFLDRHADPKSGLDKTTCAVCHGRRFSCQGCH